MLWVVRAGQKSIYAEKIVNNSKIYIPWDGYKVSLITLQSREQVRKLVEKEKETDNRTSVSNWAGQLYSFAYEMNEEDYLLIPMYKSREYVLAQIAGKYVYDENEADSLYHSREIKILCKDIPAEIFSQSVRYSLGTFRTIFKVRQEDEILTAIKHWKKGGNK